MKRAGELMEKTVSRPVLFVVNLIDVSVFLMLSAWIFESSLVPKKRSVLIALFFLTVASRM